MFFIFFLYRISESNWYVLIGRQILSLLCLPISPILRYNRDSGRSRTHNLLIRSQAFFPIELPNLVWVEGRTRTGTLMFCRHSPYSIRAPRHLSGIWESNPHLNLGRVVCYHCTNSARNDFIFCWLFLKFAICELRIVICTNTRTRTLIFGFGDRHSTIELWTCVLTLYEESNLE